MKITVEESIVRQNGFIHGSLSGHVNIGALKEFFSRVLAASTANETTALLIDLRQAQVPADAFEVYSVPEALGKIGVNKRAKMALLMRETSGECKFYETVFLNQGFAVQLFVEFEPAKAWLTGQGSS